MANELTPTVIEQWRLILNDRLGGEDGGELDRLCDMALRAAEAEKDAARKGNALKRYGAHEGTCSHLVLLTSNPPLRKPCDCGLEAALSPPKGDAKEVLPDPGGCGHDHT